MIKEFQGEHRFLSNFWFAQVQMDDEWYTSVEHAFQAAKTVNMDSRKLIRGQNMPSAAKRVGRTISIRPEWESLKLQVMEDLVKQKFTLHEKLKARLLATGDRQLIEGNYWHDTFWGVCNGEGHNHLGRILMKVRQEIRDAT